METPGRITHRLSPGAGTAAGNTLDAPGPTLSLPAEGEISNIDPTWSPDGRQIEFVSNRSGQPAVWAVNLDGTNPRQLTEAFDLVRFPSWYKSNP